MEGSQNRDWANIMNGKLSITDVIAKRMQWLTARQTVLTKNIANADTPDYIPQDLKDGSFKRMVARQSPALRPASTNSSHIQGVSLRDPDGRAREQEELYETAPAGNAVVIEEQLVNMTRNQTDYQTMTQLYRKHVAMIRMALKGSN